MLPRFCDEDSLIREGALCPADLQEPDASYNSGDKKQGTAASNIMAGLLNDEMHSQAQWPK